ncbi:Ubiquinone biosynthesis O-methyltransferase [subsurface metagenome]
MIELISEDKINSTEYLRIQMEFHHLWNRLYLKRNEIDKLLYGKLWPFTKLLPKIVSRKFEGYKLNSDLILSSNQLWAIREWEYPWAILNSEISKETKILDVGSGWSLFPLYLATISDQITSIDISEKQMNTYSPFLANLLGKTVNYEVGDALNLRYTDNSFDFVYCISVLEHLEEETNKNGERVNYHRKKLDRIAIREFLRVIKPGGNVILTFDYGTKNTDKRSFKFDYLADLLKEFNNNLLVPITDYEGIVFTKEKENLMKKLWKIRFPYSETRPPYGVVGIISTK